MRLISHTMVNMPEKFFRGYYDHYCYLPFYVFCDRFPLVAYLRQRNIDGAKHTAAVLKLLVNFIRSHWSAVQIIFRGTSAFCRQLMLKLCDHSGVDYIGGIARNPRPEALIEQLWNVVEQQHAKRKEQGHFGSTKAFLRYTNWQKTGATRVMLSRKLS